MLEQALEAAAGEPELKEFTEALSDQITATRDAVGALLAAREADPDWSLRVADAWYADKVKAARFGVQWLLPEASYRWQRVMARNAILPEIS